MKRVSVLEAAATSLDTAIRRAVCNAFDVCCRRHGAIFSGRVEKKPDSSNVHKQNPKSRPPQTGKPARDRTYMSSQGEKERLHRGEPSNDDSASFVTKSTEVERWSNPDNFRQDGRTAVQRRGLKRCSKNHGTQPSAPRKSHAIRPGVMSTIHRSGLPPLLEFNTLNSVWCCCPSQLPASISTDRDLDGQKDAGAVRTIHEPGAAQRLALVCNQNPWYT